MVRSGIESYFIVPGFRGWFWRCADNLLFNLEPLPLALGFSFIVKFQVIKMFTAINFGMVRELQAILTLYIATVLSGFSMGFSAISIPGIKEEMLLNNNQSSSVIPSIKASEEELSWFGMLL